MICTSNYKRLDSNGYKTYSISGDRGLDAGYTKDVYLDLAPKKGFWREWKNNRGKVPFEVNTKFYITEYWNQVLSKLDPEKVYKDLDNSILLCYEDNMEFCHRHVVAAWFELLFDVQVPEVISEEDNLKEVERPSYVKDYLEEVMKSTLDMRGFNSIRALYLYNKSEEYEKLAIEDGDKILYYKRLANYFRETAICVEEEYKSNKIEKKKAKQD